MRARLLALVTASACTGGAGPPSRPEAAGPGAFAEPFGAPVELGAARRPESLDGPVHFEARPAPAGQPSSTCSTTVLSLVPPKAALLSQINSVLVDVSIGRGCDARTISIELFSPRGSPFEVRTKALHGGNHAQFRFPVAGSAIEQRGLSGAWQVRTLIDGKNAGSSELELPR